MGHHVLRLAFCSSDSARRWFLATECRLFRWRFSTAPSGARRAALRALALEYDEVARDDVPAAVAGFMDSGRGVKGKVYAGPWEGVADLVAQRRVAVAGGVAYVPEELVASLVVTQFRSALSRALAVAAVRLGDVRTFPCHACVEYVRFGC